MFRWRNAVATMSTETMIVAPANNHGALPPMLNAPPEFVVNRSVSTPGIRSAGASCRRSLRPELREAVQQIGEPGEGEQEGGAAPLYAVHGAIGATAPERP